MSGRKFKPMKCKTTKLKSCLCAILFLLLSYKCAHTVSFTFSTLLQGHKHNIKVSSRYTGGMLNRNDLSSLQEGCASTPETCPYRNHLLILLLYNGKDTEPTSHTAEHLLRPEM